jgi:hypothetical protein
LCWDVFQPSFPLPPCAQETGKDLEYASSDQIIQQRREEISQAIADGTIAAKHTIGKDGKLVKAARQNTLSNFFSKKSATETALSPSNAASKESAPVEKKGLFKYMGKEPESKTDDSADPTDKEGDAEATVGVCCMPLLLSILKQCCVSRYS